MTTTEAAGTMETLRDDWATFDKAVKELHHGDLETFRRVNLTLGWNLVKALPILLTRNRSLEREVHNLEVRNRALKVQVEAGEKALQQSEDRIEPYKDLVTSLRQDLLEANNLEIRDA